MRINKKHCTKKFFFVFLSALNILFIFFQSFLPADSSGAESGYVVDFINSIAEYLGIGKIFTHYFIRKLAHFSEFALLGILLSISFSLYKNNKRISTCFTLSSCIIVAVSDECIQLFSPGRACSVSDMLLDSSGSIFGITIFLLISLIKRKAKERRGKL